MRRLFSVLLTAVAALGAAAGCRPAPARPGPADTVERYAAAVRLGDAEAAYALLDERTRAQVPFERFEALMRENREELREQAQELTARAAEGVEPQARLQVDGGGALTLIREEGRWRIDSGVLDTPVLRNPRDAVLALRSALKRRSMRGVERVFARETRAALDEEIESFLEDTADELDLDYEIRGNHAVVRTTSGREIRLVREAGEWRIVDVR